MNTSRPHMRPVCHREIDIGAPEFRLDLFPSLALLSRRFLGAGRAGEPIRGGTIGLNRFNTRLLRLAEDFVKRIFSRVRPRADSRSPARYGFSHVPDFAARKMASMTFILPKASSSGTGTSRSSRMAREKASP